MSEVERRETMWAELSPDCYDGPDCDQIKHRWISHCEGDKGDNSDFACLELDARTFPPGTKVVISEPLCPQCGSLRFPNTLTNPVSWPQFCGCGFDWEAWTLEEYS